jgi:hypothetical protein
MLSKSDMTLIINALDHDQGQIHVLTWFILWKKEDNMTKLKSWIILIWPWLLIDLDHHGQIIGICLNCHNKLCYLFTALIFTWTKEHIRQNGHSWTKRTLLTKMTWWLI